MKHYHFCETTSGEAFIVCADSEDEAYEIAADIAMDLAEQWADGEPELECYGTISEEEAENSGLDEY